MKILVTGGSGLLGTEIVTDARRRGWGISAPSRVDMDITDPARCRSYITAERPDWVVHCAAYTAVDRAEDEPEVAERVNVGGTGNVAHAALEAGARIAYLSSDYVFSGVGRTPWQPNDPVAPHGVYARTKLAGEEAVQAVRPAGGGSGPSGVPLIVRTSWLYGAARRDFVDVILERSASGQAVRVVNDQVGRPTWSRNAARCVLDLVSLGAEGPWHVADGGEASWYDFASAALSLAGEKVEVEGVATEEWGARAPRPAYSVLDVSATEERLGREMQPWQEALAEYRTEQH